jgi:EAL domain-containing protein (putative c-di-GMP-specific phosphodiesterase class I)
VGICAEGLAQCRDWRERFGDKLVLSFNVSPVQFGRAGLLDELRRACSTSIS